MQKTLTEYHATSRTTHTLYYCVNCVLDFNSPESNKYEARIFMKKVRVMLKPIAGSNILVCPRCGAQHFTPDFFRGRSKHHKHL